MTKRKQHSTAFKSKVALKALRGDPTIAELASKYGIHPTLVTKWKKQAVDGLADVFSGKGRQARDKTHEAEIKELHAKIGQLTVEKDFYPKPSDVEPRPEE